MQIMSHNPFVILGCGLTTAALIGMIFKSFKGDKVGAQKMMQYRIAGKLVESCVESILILYQILTN
jgi:hypothetical protein